MSLYLKRLFVTPDVVTVAVMAKLNGVASTGNSADRGVLSSTARALVLIVSVVCPVGGGGGSLLARIHEEGLEVG